MYGTNFNPKIFTDIKLVFYPLSHIIKIRDYRFLLVLAIGFRVDVYRGGIMDKTKMCEDALWAYWHDFLYGYCNEASFISHYIKAYREVC